MDLYTSDPLILSTRVVLPQWGEGGICACTWQAWQGLTPVTQTTLLPIVCQELYLHPDYVDQATPVHILAHMAWSVADAVQAVQP